MEYLSICILPEIYSNIPGKILFIEPITLLSGKFFQNKREHIDRFIDQLLHMADIFLRKKVRPEHLLRILFAICMYFIHGIKKQRSKQSRIRQIKFI